MKKHSRKRRVNEIPDYDKYDTSDMIDPANPLRLGDIGLALPSVPPTQTPPGTTNEQKGLALLQKKYIDGS